MKTVTSQSFPGGKKVKQHDDRSGLRQARRLALLMSAAAIAWQAQTAHAATYTWDPGVTPATPSGGTGTWDLVTSEWSNGTGDVVWTDNTGANDTAVFGGTAGTITLNATNLGAHGLIFTTPGYVLAGTGIVKVGTTTVAATGIDTSGVGSGSITFGNLDAGSNQTWNFASSSVTFTGAVRDAGVSHLTLTVNGTGTTQFSGGLTLSNTGSARTVVLAGSENINISGLIQDGSVNVTNGLIYNGSATLSLTNPLNNFQVSATQGVAVDSGTLAVSDRGALGNSANPLFIGNNSAQATFEGIGTNTLAISNPVTLNGGTVGTAVVGGATPLNFTGVITGVGSSNQLAITNTGGTTCSGTVFLGNNATNSRTLVISGNSPLLISGVVGDASGATGANPCSLSYTGNSTLSLTNTSNSFTGTLTVGGGGTLALANGAASTPSTFAFGNNTGAATLLPSGGNLTIGQPVTLNSTTANPDAVAGTNNVTFNGAVSGAQSFSQLNNIGTGILTLAGPVYCSNNLTNGRTLQFGGSGNTTIGGVISDANGVGGAGSIAYDGSGTLTLTNNNAYNGTTTLSSGTLNAANASGSATSTGNVTLNAGILASGAVGAISGNVLAGTAAHTIAPGGVGTVGTLTIGGLTSSTLTTLNFDLGTGAGTITNGDNLILGSGTVSIASGTLMTFGGTPVAGNDYQLIGDTSAGAVVGAIPLGNFTLPAAPAGLSYSLAVSSGFIDLDVVSSGPPNLTWNNNGGDNLWNATSSNWNNGSSNTTYSDGAKVTFNDNNPSSTPANYNVTLNTTVSPGSVMLSNASNNYVISGSGSIAGTGSLTRNNIGTATLNTVNTYSGGTDVFQGTLIAGVAGAIPNGPVTIEFGTLQLAASTGGTTITSLAINGNGTLDITNNHVIIDYGSGPDPVSSIAALLATGYNGGAWNGVGGITSSAIAANPGYGVGYADAADTGNPAGLASGTMEIAFTLLGDADLNHTVNGIDFGILAANFNKGVSRWDQGDFNYDNIVNGVDFGSLAANFNKGASSASDFAALEAFAAANGLLADVPEPATLALLAFGTIGMLARRRRKTFG